MYFLSLSSWIGNAWQRQIWPLFSMNLYLSDKIASPSYICIWNHSICLIVASIYLSLANKFHLFPVPPFLMFRTLHNLRSVQGSDLRIQISSDVAVEKNWAETGLTFFTCSKGESGFNELTDLLLPQLKYELPDGFGGALHSGSLLCSLLPLHARQN